MMSLRIGIVLLAILGAWILPEGVAHSSCSLGSVAVSSEGGTLGCVSAYNGRKFAAHTASSNDCPGDSIAVNLAAGIMCQKTLVSGPELILRPDERCPSGYVRFVDMEGANACRSQAASGVTAITWPRCPNGAVPLVTASGEQCRSSVANVTPSGGGTQCPSGAYPALDAHDSPICVMR